MSSRDIQMSSNECNDTTESSDITVTNPRLLAAKMTLDALDKDYDAMVISYGQYITPNPRRNDTLLCSSSK